MFNGTVVAEINEQQHLYIILDLSLLKKHLNEKIIKAKKNLGIIKHLTIFLHQSQLIKCIKLLYVTYQILSVQTQLGATLTDLMEKAERKYQAALLLPVHGKVQVVPNFAELGWESLSERRWCKRILQMHKIVSNYHPFYLKTNSLDTADPCTVKILKIRFTK